MDCHGASEKVLDTSALDPRNSDESGVPRGCFATRLRDQIDRKGL
jgi:hypothetical protein